MFLLYISYLYLPNISNNFIPILFAEDINFIFSNINIQDILLNNQNIIDKLYNWLNLNKLSLNINKIYILT